MKTLSKELYEAVESYCKSYRVPPSNFTQHATIDGVEYTYMSEVETHKDDPFGYGNTDTEWTIKFVAAKEDFFFIYKLDGKEYCVEPELGVEYTFNFGEYHAFLHKNNIKYFNDHEHWYGFEPKQELACIFLFIDNKNT